MSKDGKRCIFCPYVGKLTDEHIWGDWTRKYVPRPHNKHEFRSVVGKTPTQEVTEPIRIRAGDPLNSQVKVVCKPCNSGWMSQMQERAKPDLIPLFEGQRTVLNTAAQTRIATWATMATMTGEYLSREPQNVAVPQSERTWFRKNRVPPANWRILIGRYQRQAGKGQWYHVSMPIYTAKEAIRRKAINDRQPNHQTTTFVVGQLYVYVFSGFFRNIVMDWDFRTAPDAAARMTQIWPIQYPSVLCSVADLTDKDAHDLSTAFLRWSNEVATSHGYY